jgi:hopanoid biosynthesis associated RND transporter like protein HpnN
MAAIGEALAAWVGIVMRFRWAVIVAASVAAFLGVMYAAENLGVNTDTANMISSRLPWRKDFNDYRDRFPMRDRNIIAVVEGTASDDAAGFAAELADALRAEPDLFTSVFLAGSGEFFERNALLYASVDELEALGDRLALAQPLLGRLRAAPSGAGVIDLLEQVVTTDTVPAATAEGLDDLMQAVAGTLASAAQDRSVALDWGALMGGATDDATRQILLVQPVLDFTRMRPARAAIERMREIASTLGAHYRQPVTMRLTGTLAMEHEELDSVTESAGRAGILALLMVAAVLYWSLRSWRLLWISIVSLFAGLIGTAAVAAGLVGHLNLLSVAFAVLYVGLGVDFILHIDLRVKEIMHAGRDIEHALQETMRGVGASLVVCTITTAAGFYAFIPTSFEGVSELGLISGTGMFISFFTSITLLPALLAVFYRVDGSSWRSINALPSLRLASRSPRAIVVVTIVLVLAGLASLPGVYFDSNPVNLRDPDSESVATLQELVAASDADLLTMVARADDAGTARAWAATLVDSPAVDRVTTVDSLVPADQAEKLLVLEDIDLLMGTGFADIEPERADPRELHAALVALRDALAAGRTGSAQSVALLSSLDELLERLNGHDDQDALLRELDRALLGDLPTRLALLQTALGAEAFDRNGLPTELSARWIDGDGGELVEIVPRENITDAAAAAQFVDAVRAIVPSATGLPVVYREAARTVVQSFQSAMTYAVVLVALILVVFLRSMRDTVLSLVPILCAAAVTAGMTVWLGIPFNFANIIALPLLVGIGVDNSIHMVHRTRSEAGSGNALETSTPLAVLASGLTTIASFGNLAFSTHQGMASMGILLTIGMLTTMAASLVFLPALLQLTERR